LDDFVKESTRTPDFLTRTAFAALGTGLVIGLALAAKWGWSTASGFVVALAWGLANFAVLAAILKTATDPDGIRVGRLAGLVALKLFGLYTLAIWILLHRWFPLGAFAGGFSWTLLVGLLRAVGSLTIPSGIRARTPGNGQVR
jgi:hypothetical protein